MIAPSEARLVAQRAGNRGEYCQMHQSLQGATFHIEHIVPRSKGGTSELHNLAWACPSCTSRKADRLDAKDPQSGEVVRLFHPRTESWPEHFRWDATTLVGLSPTGRATVSMLDLNQPRRLAIRVAEAAFGLFPP